MPVAVACSNCSRTFRVADTSIGKRVKCPGCQTVITAQAKTAAAAEAPSGDPFGGLTEENVAERRLTPDDDARDAALGRVSVPAWGMMLTRGAEALILVVLLAASFQMGLERAGLSDDVVFGGLARSVMVGLLVVYNSVIVYGASKMDKLRSLGLAKGACVMALLPLGACCLFSAPFAIWGLVVLNNPEVSRHFRR